MVSVADHTLAEGENTVEFFVSKEAVVFGFVFPTDFVSTRCLSRGSFHAERFAENCDEWRYFFVKEEKYTLCEMLIWQM